MNPKCGREEMMEIKPGGSREGKLEMKLEAAGKMPQKAVRTIRRVMVTDERVL